MKNLKNILIMDDEELILNSTAQLLTLLGYNVFKALNGNEALDIVKNNLNNENKINIAILDTFIPNNMGGVDCCKALKKIDNNIFLVIVSGDPTLDVMTNYSNFGFNYALSKPYSLKMLQQMLLEAKS